MTRKENGVKKMKVEAVSNLGFKSNNFSFGEKQRVHDNVPAESSNRASDYKKSSKRNHPMDGDISGLVKFSILQT